MKTKITNKKICIVLTAIMLIPIFALLVNASSLSKFIDDFFPIERQDAEEEEGVGTDPRILPWYEVADWEVEVCRKWGGTELAQSGATVQGSDSFIHQTTITLSAVGELLADGNVIYKISYYIQPLQDVNIKLRLKNIQEDEDEGKETIVDITELNAGQSSAGFEIIITDEDFDENLFDPDPLDGISFELNDIQIQMSIDTDRDGNINSILKMPVVSEEYTGCTTDCGTTTTDGTGAGAADEEEGDMAAW